MGKELTDDDVETIAGCGLILAFLPMLVVTVSLDAFVARTIWEWFIVPEFSISPLTWPAAVGIGLLASQWTHQYSYGKNSKAIDAFAAWSCGCVIRPLVLLFIALVASKFLY